MPNTPTRSRGEMAASLRRKLKLWSRFKSQNHQRRQRANRKEVLGTTRASSLWRWESQPRQGPPGARSRLLTTMKQTSRRRALRKTMAKHNLVVELRKGRKRSARMRTSRVQVSPRLTWSCRGRLSTAGSRLTRPRHQPSGVGSFRPMLRIQVKGLKIPLIQVEYQL